MVIRFSIRFPVRHQLTPILCVREIVDEFNFSGRVPNFGKQILGLTTGISRESDGKSDRESDATKFAVYMLDFHVGQRIVSPSDLHEIGWEIRPGIGWENVRVDGPLHATARGKRPRSNATNQSRAATMQPSLGVRYRVAKNQNNLGLSTKKLCFAFTAAVRTKRKYDRARDGGSGDRLLKKYMNHEKRNSGGGDEESSKLQPHFVISCLVRNIKEGQSSKLLQTKL
jgi:hypothetical protein